MNNYKRFNYLIFDIRFIRNIAYAIAFALLLVSCGSGKLYTEYKTVDENTGWSRKDKMVFEPEIKDTVNLYNVFVNVRHGSIYPYRNLYVFLTTDYPDGRKEVDTLNCILADDQNKWLGDGAGDLWDNSILLESNVRFPKAGKYKFTYEQGMRIDPLPMILDMGLTIERVEEK
jgi:gliding motility-associated lipoprotein GldH